MTNIHQELIQVKNLLRTERKEDIEQFKRRTSGKTIAERKELGTCWHPVLVQRVRTGLAGKVMVEVRQNGSTPSHSFQSGKTVSLFTSNGASASSLNGVVNYVRGDVMLLTLGVETMPDWLKEGKLGVDLLFDENSYRQMEAALDAVIHAEDGRLGQMKAILLGEIKPELAIDSELDVQLEGLNEVQKEAVKMAISAKDVAVIHGPPGTGKTTTLVAAITEVLKRYMQVLVCAPSNSAVDLLVEKLSAVGVETLRIGHPARVDDQIINQTLDAKITHHPSYKDLKRLRVLHAETRRQAKKFKRNFGSSERIARQKLLDESKRLREESELLEEYIRFDIFRRSQVVATTLTGAAGPILKSMRFPVVFIDEAAQGLEPATWIPMLIADKVVMAGDHCQLPPTVKSFEAAKGGLSETLFEKVVARHPSVAKMLATQYRMPPDVMGFSSQYFYEGGLIAAPNTLIHPIPGERELIFVDTAGSGFTEYTDKETLSTRNNEEGRFCLSLLSDVIKRVGLDTIRQNQWDVGIISPYRAQVQYLKESLDEQGFVVLKSLGDALTVDTIDGFQGQERDIVLISLVRSNTAGEIGFLSDVRRMNVALTRAKRKLIVVGDSATLGTHPFYQQFLDYVEEKMSYSSIYEWMET